MDDDLQKSQLFRSWEVYGSQAVHDTKLSLAEIFLFPFPVIFVYKVFDTKYKLLYLVPSFHYLAALKDYNFILFCQKNDVHVNLEFRLNRVEEKG